jgi:DNA-binding transcriptional LysR family regulator
MDAPCGVRAIAEEFLDAAGVPWTEIFIVGGVAAVAAAVMAGLGVAALAPRMLPLVPLTWAPSLGFLIYHAAGPAALADKGRSRAMRWPRFRQPSGARFAANL